MFLSADGGTTWSTAGHLPAGENIRVLALDGSGTIYLGADSALERLDPHEINPLSLDILRSTDTGTTWKIVSSFPRPIVNAMVLACNGAGDVIVGYHASGFALSHNKGESWTRVPGYWCSGAAASSSRVLFTASAKGNVRRSDDHGATWSTCPGLPGEGLGSYGQIFTSSNADTVFVAELSEPGTIYRSTNGGWGWTPVWTGYGTNVCRSARGVYYFATADELRRSTDGGTHWTLAARAGAEIASLAVSDSGAVLVGTKRGTVIRWNGE
ncbi:MAG: exo-alpha-sialidase [Ignavibacteriae bacterium]|nr:exo-alpha-sialidase [Ignavibacteriota bacterium]